MLTYSIIAARGEIIGTKYLRFLLSTAWRDFQAQICLKRGAVSERRIFWPTNRFSGWDRPCRMIFRSLPSSHFVRSVDSFWNDFLGSCRRGCLRFMCTITWGFLKSVIHSHPTPFANWIPLYFFHVNQYSCTQRLYTFTVKPFGISRPMTHLFPIRSISCLWVPHPFMLRDWQTVSIYITRIPLDSFVRNFEGDTITTFTGDSPQSCVIIKGQICETDKLQRKIHVREGRGKSRRSASRKLDTKERIFTTLGNKSCRLWRGQCRQVMEYMISISGHPARLWLEALE